MVGVMIVYLETQRPARPEATEALRKSICKGLRWFLRGAVDCRAPTKWLRPASKRERPVCSSKFQARLGGEDVPASDGRTAITTSEKSLTTGVTKLTGTARSVPATQVKSMSLLVELATLTVGASGTASVRAWNAKP